MSLVKTKSKPKKNDKGLFYQTYTVAPAPSRDYYGLQLYQKKFIWIRWKISHGPYLRPLQNTVDLDDFLKDTTMQTEISHIFGPDTSDLINDVALERWTLASMPSAILDGIFRFLNVNDICNLMQVSKRIQKECSKDELWKILFRRSWKILLPSDIQRASSVGWKQVYKEKIAQKNQKTNIKKPDTKFPTKISHNKVEKPKPKPNLPESKSSVSLIETKKPVAIRCSSAVFGKGTPVKSNKLNKSLDRPISSSKSKQTVDDHADGISRGKYERVKPAKSSSRTTDLTSKKLEKEESSNQKIKITSVKTRPTSNQLEKKLRK